MKQQKTKPKYNSKKQAKRKKELNTRHIHKQISRRDADTHRTALKSQNCSKIKVKK